MFEEVPKSRRFAYARISSISQQDNSSLEAQKQEFIQKGVPEKNIRVEIGSAADKIEDRPVFYRLIDYELKENDLLLVTKIDRCSRNTLEFLKLQERLHKKGVRFISLDLPYANDMAVNRLIATNLAAKKNGKYFGRKTVIDKKLISQVQDLKENEKTTTLSENVKIFNLLQFLSFTRTKKHTEKKIYDQIYCLIEFTLKDYIEFSGVNRINQYQRNKFIKILYTFQETKPWLTYFTDTHFQSLLVFPYLNYENI